MDEKVPLETIDKLKKQTVEENKALDGVDALDKGCGRLFSKIGRYIVENW